MNADAPRIRQMLVAGAIAVAIVAGSTPRIVGDGGEYLVQALNFAAGDGPSIGRQSQLRIQPQIPVIAPELGPWDLTTGTAVGSDLRRDYLHFWFYALLTAPFLWLALETGAPVLAAFTITNLAFFGVALWVALPRIGVAASVLLFAGPVVWWLDKAHTEIFTFSLLLIAVLLARDKPWWALVAAGAGATQNPPVAAVFIVIGALTAWRQPAALTDRRVLIGGSVGALLMALQPLYTYSRYGTPSLLLRATTPGTPTPAEMTAVVLDPTLGLLGNYPVFLLVAMAAVLFLGRRDWRALATFEVAAVALLAAVFLYSFGRTANFHHGATPSMSRYALWLVPLLAPLLARVSNDADRGWRRFLAGSAAVSAVVCIFAFHPAVRQNSREPTWAALWLWTQHPGWQNPLPEVFTETLMHQEALIVPVSTAGCEKVLLGVPSDGGDLLWPLPCYPVSVPDECRAPGRLCYANRRDGDYDFIPAPGRRSGAMVSNPAAWTAGEAAAIRALFDAYGWGGSAPRPIDFSHLRQAQDVSVMTLGTPERFLMILQNFGAAPTLRFRFPEVMSGSLLDSSTGTVLQVLDAVGGSDEIWELALPTTHETLVLSMTMAEPPRAAAGQSAPE